MTLVDDNSRFKRVYLLKKKSDAFACFKKYVAEVELELGGKVKQLRDDKGGEYIGADFNKYCMDKGISHQHTTKATPQQNGVAEHLNWSLAEGVVAMLNQAKLPVGFWGQAVPYLTHILNVTPSSALSETTSYEVWKGQKPDLTMYQTFGCRAYIHIQKKECGALDPHSSKCIFIGFEDGFKGWKVYNPTTHKVSVSRDIIFDESSFPGTAVNPCNDNITDTILLHTLWPDKGSDSANPDFPRNDDQEPPPPSVPDLAPLHPAPQNPVPPGTPLVQLSPPHPLDGVDSPPVTQPQSLLPALQLQPVHHTPAGPLIPQGSGPV